MTEYKLLLPEDRKKISARLISEQYFYHCTPESCLLDIKSVGLDPKYENDRSKYFCVRREPAKAMRYCTHKGLPTGLGTATTRATEWDEHIGLSVQTEKIVILRVSADCLLKRSFGLDHSFWQMGEAAEGYLKNKDHLTDKEFLDLVTKYGIISCYEIIPANELDILREDEADFIRDKNKGKWGGILK